MNDAPDRIWACMSGPMVGLFVSGGNNGGWPEYVRADIAHAALEAAVLAERERCAKVAESFHFTRTHTDEFLGNTMSSSLVKPFKVAAAIRAQGEQK